MNFRILLPTILVIFSLTTNAQTSVIGGENTARNEYPAMVELTTDGQHHCGGILISPRWVLTAAHCALDLPQFPKPTHASVNLWVRDHPHSGTEKIKIDSMFVYPEFSVDSFGHVVDLALIRLEYSSISDTAFMANKSEDSLYKPDSIVQVLGWGVKDTNANFSDTLKRADVKLMQLDTCIGRYNQIVDSFHLENFNFCGEPPDSVPQGSSAGDSGGPIFLEDNDGALKVIGIVSGGKSLFTTHEQPGIYTRINIFKSWIDSVIQANRQVTGKQRLSPNILNLRIKQDRDNIYLSFNSSKTDAKTWKLNVYDLLGRRMYTAKLDEQASQHQINKSALNSDFAIISITGEAGTFTKKVIVR